MISTQDLIRNSLAEGWLQFGSELVTIPELFYLDCKLTKPGLYIMNIGT